jgi:hypothetical protein
MKPQAAARQLGMKSQAGFTKRLAKALENKAKEMVNAD